MYIQVQLAAYCNQWCIIWQGLKFRKESSITLRRYFVESYQSFPHFRADRIIILGKGHAASLQAVGRSRRWQQFERAGHCLKGVLIHHGWVANRSRKGVWQGGTNCSMGSCSIKLRWCRSGRGQRLADSDLDVLKHGCICPSSQRFCMGSRQRAMDEKVRRIQMSSEIRRVLHQRFSHLYASCWTKIKSVDEY